MFFFASFIFKYANRNQRKHKNKHNTSKKCCFWRRPKELCERRRKRVVRKIPKVISNGITDEWKKKKTPQKTWATYNKTTKQTTISCAEHDLLFILRYFILLLFMCTRRRLLKCLSFSADPVRKTRIENCQTKNKTEKKKKKKFTKLKSNWLCSYSWCTYHQYCSGFLWSVLAIGREFERPKICTQKYQKFLSQNLYNNTLL